MNVLSRQAGSIVSYLVVGVLLLGLLGGSLYMAKHRAATARQQAAPQVAVKPTPQPVKQPAKPITPAPKVPAKPAPATPPATPAPAATDTSSHLPSTGPTDAMMQLLALGSLAAAATIYVASERRTTAATPLLDR